MHRHTQTLLELFTADQEGNFQSLSDFQQHVRFPNYQKCSEIAFSNSKLVSCPHELSSCSKKGKKSHTSQMELSSQMHALGFLSHLDITE